LGASLTATITHDPAAIQPNVSDEFAVLASTPSVMLSETPADPGALTVTLTRIVSDKPVTTTIASSNYTVSGKTITFTSALAGAGTLKVGYAVNHPLSGSYGFG